MSRKNREVINLGGPGRMSSLCFLKRCPYCDKVLQNHPFSIYCSPKRPFKILASKEKMNIGGTE